MACLIINPAIYNDRRSDLLTAQSLPTTTTTHELVYGLLLYAFLSWLHSYASSSHLLPDECLLTSPSASANYKQIHALLV